MVVVAVIAAATSVHAASAWWIPVSNASEARSDTGQPEWRLSGGLAVERGHAPDAQTPPGMEFVAGTPTTPGVAIAAGHGQVWRRQQSGRWSRSLLLLPQSLVAGTPAVTALAAFDRPLSDSIYLATDGFGVLITTDGGYSWIRDDLGLPGHVRGLVTNSQTRNLYAVTNNGVWVHHLAALPAPPPLMSGELLWHWIGIIAIALASVAAGTAGLRRALQ